MTEIETLLRDGAPSELPPAPELAPAAELARLLDVAYATEDSPLGRLLLAATPRGLVRIAYLDAGEQEAGTLAQLASRISPRILGSPRALDPVRRELEQFFAGVRRSFEVPVDLRLAGPGFQRRVLTATARIPFGTSRSYKQIAADAGSPNAFRAAGTALGHNPLPIVIPCHRVRHSGGGLGGYTGGLDRKRALLAIEGGLSDR
jgi:methylated-DNA-[protein]-cysteine S-methyltransferase